MYRVRNAIVHAGETNKHIQVLGEHLHIYCDDIIMKIIHKLALNDCFINIQDVLVDTRLLVERKKGFYIDNEAINENDIKRLFYNNNSSIK